MKPGISAKTRALIRQALREDIGRGDITTQALVPPHLQGRAYIQAKANGVLAGSEVVSEVFRAVDSHLKVKKHISDGGRIRKGQKIFSVRGRAASILKGERVALNFLSHLSGVATLTRRFVEKVKGNKVKIYDTRKTTPLWRELEKNAVRTGGGYNHRFGLWDQVLVKDNHWVAIKKGDRHVFSSLCLSPFLKHKFIEIEVKNLEELVSVLPLRPDAILLDNFSVSDLRRAVQMTKAFRKRPILEASGGVHLGNVQSVAKTGVDRISIGAITHSVPAVDFSLTLE